MQGIKLEPVIEMKFVEECVLEIEDTLELMERNRVLALRSGKT
jgi:hypothetical protein